MKPLLLIMTVASVLLGSCSGNNGRSILETGTLEAREATVSAQVTGTVRRVLADEGTLVRSGDTLVVLDDTEWRYQLRQADANLRAADSQYRMAVEGPRKEDVAQAKAAYESARNDLQRMEELWASKTIPEKQLEDARTRFTVAEQTYVKLTRGSREEEITLAQARRDQAAAQLAVLQKKVADCAITAPIAGIVTTRFVETGELVVPGMAVARLADLTIMDVTIYVSEAVLPRILLGQNAEVRVDAFDSKSFEGTVVFISPSAEFTPKNIQTREERTKLVFAVKISVRNPDMLLKSGIPADVRLELRQDAP
jgi:HlyD family secretion protein